MIKDGIVRIDLNEAYNTYYASGYNCPIPPGENYLSVAIMAGENEYAKQWH